MRITSISDFIVFPFEYEGHGGGVLSWRESSREVNSDVLLPHVREVAGKSGNLAFMEIDSNGGNPLTEALARLLKEKTEAVIPSMGNAAVRFVGDHYQVPLLVLSPVAKVGLLIIPVGPACGDLEQACEFNYRMIKLDHQAPVLRTAFASIARAASASAPNPKVIEKAQAIRRLRDLLCPGSAEGEWWELEYTIPRLRDVLMSDFTGVKYYNTHRANLYCYMNSDSDSLGEADESALLRMMHGLGPKYHLDPAAERATMLHTFSDICIGASTECAFLLTHASAQSASYGFFREYRRNILPRYLLIYILALMQQQIQISLSNSLSAIEVSDDSSAMHRIDEIYRSVTRAQAVFHFLDVSGFSHLNKYYRYCMDSLHVGAYYLQTKSKIHDLYDVANHLVEKRRYSVNLLMTLLVGILTLVSAIAAVIDIYTKRDVLISQGFAVPAILTGLALGGSIIFVVLYRRMK